jgi:hydroxymethylglutaryl-CoA synthase
VESRAWDGRRLALVVATDVAVYAAGPARPAGGGGAVAMLVGPDAPLDLERGLAGAWMSDEWDFYKPAGCGLWPVVDGARSVAAYLKGLDACWAALCDKADARLAGVEEEKGAGGAGGGGAEEDERRRRQNSNETSSSSSSSTSRPPFSLSDVDHVVMHAPYGKLLRKGFARMVAADERRRRAREGKGDKEDEGNEKDASPVVGPGPGFDERAAVKATAAAFDAYVGPSCWLAAEVGNMYAASVHAGLAALVEAKGGKGKKRKSKSSSNKSGGEEGGGGEDENDNNANNDGNGLEGARILVYSYGSGAAACLFSVTARQVSSDPGSSSSSKFTLEKLAASLKISEALCKRRRATPEEFTKALALAEARWGACDYRPSAEAIAAVGPGVWYLEGVDEKHRRRYERKPPLSLVEGQGQGEGEGGEKKVSSSSSSPFSSSPNNNGGRPFPPPPRGLLSTLAAGASADNLAADLLEKLSAG